MLCVCVCVCERERERDLFNYVDSSACCVSSWSSSVLHVIMPVHVLHMLPVCDFYDVGQCEVSSISVYCSSCLLINLTSILVSISRTCFWETKYFIVHKCDTQKICILKHMFMTLYKETCMMLLFLIACVKVADKEYTWLVLEVACSVAVLVIFCRSLRAARCWAFYWAGWLAIKVGPGNFMFFAPCTVI